MPKPAYHPDQLTLESIESAVALTVRTEVKAAVREELRRDVQSGSDPKRPLGEYPQRMRIDQVAAYLNCSENHVRNLFEEGRLEGVNIALSSSRQSLRIFRDSLAEYESQKS
jgi:excisionase family DNA binding protein